MISIRKSHELSVFILRLGQPVRFLLKKRARLYAPLVYGLSLTVPAAIPAQPAPAAAPQDGRAVLEEVRRAYENLSAYHFEHHPVISQTGTGAQPATIADVTLGTASELSAEAMRRYAEMRTNATMADNPLAGIPLDIERLRLEERTARGSAVTVVGSQAAWRFRTPAMEYTKGADLRDIAGTYTGGGMAFGPHLVALTLPPNDRVGDARVVRDETLDIGGQQRPCTVLELTLKPAAPLRAAPGEPRPSARTRQSDPFTGISGILLQLRMTGLTDPADRALYLPATAEEQPPRFTLWIDKAWHIPLRRHLVEWVSRGQPRLPKAGASGGSSPAPPEQVQLELTDTFSVARVTGPLPEDLFRFEPPPGAKEVPNTRQQRK